MLMFVLCSKLCQHKSPRPIPEARRTPEGVHLGGYQKASYTEDTRGHPARRTPEGVQLGGHERCPARRTPEGVLQRGHQRASC